MKNSIKRKGMIRSTLITMVLLILFLLAVIMIFFGNGLLKEGFDKIRNLISGVPEVDPAASEMDFFRTNDIQLKFLSSWNTAMKNALAGTAANTYGGCIMTLSSIEYDGFYKKGANYNLYLEQTDSDTIAMKLTMYAKQNYEDDEVKTEKPITTINLDGAQLCIIEGDSATEFYNEFNDINPGEVPDIKKIKHVPVHTIKISSGQAEDTIRKIGYNPTATPENDEGYTWETFFRKNGDKTIIYAVRLVDDDGTNHICLFPTYNDKLDVFSNCGGVKDGLIQTDCFDKDGEKRSLKYNFENELIPPYYICSDEAPLQTVQNIQIPAVQS